MSSCNGVDRDLLPLLEAVRAAGWRERPIRSGGGLLVYPPDGGRPVALHQSVAGGTVRNVRAQLRRGGLDV